jgi:hypothetical protein
MQARNIPFLVAEGRRAAKAKDVVMGRPAVLTDHRAMEALRRLVKGESCRSLAKSFDCHHRFEEAKARLRQ